jgi:hypothetical protein
MLMADPWELILHHSYAGTPGVISDLSPTRRSPGRAVDIEDNAFLKNGATPGSGAIEFRSATNMIRVPRSASWTTIGGLRAEIVCSTDIVRNGGYLFDGGTFNLYTDGENHWAGEYLTIDGGQNNFGMGGASPPLPASEWITISYDYNSFGLEVAIDGQPIYSTTDFWRVGILGSDGVIIGNNATGHAGLRGRIDDIKIWRNDPTFVGSTFTGRPMDEDVARCWAEWQRKLSEVLSSRPGCAEKLNTQLQIALGSLIRDIRQIDGAQDTLNWAVHDYHDRWADGRLDDIKAVLADFLAWMHRGGVRPENNAALQALYASECMQIVGESMGPMRCDPEFTDLLDGVAPIP